MFRATLRKVSPMRFINFQSVVALVFLFVGFFFKPLIEVKNDTPPSIQNENIFFRDYPILYSRHNCGGRRKKLTISIPDLYSFKNKASSVYVPSGFRLVLYDGKNYTRDYLEVTPGTYNLAPFHDKASSVQVFYHGKLWERDTSEPAGGWSDKY